MTHEERKNKYSEYIRELKSNNGVLTNKARALLKEAFDVTDDDLRNTENEILDESTLDYRSLMFDILMEDLRDMRDIRHICSTRKDLMTAFIDVSDMSTNKDYIFVL